MEDYFLFEAFFAEIKKKGCYPFFEGFRRQTPRFERPKGRHKTSVSTSFTFFPERNKVFKVEAFFAYFLSRKKVGQ